MTNKEAIEYGVEQLKFLGGRHAEFVQKAIESLSKEIWISSTPTEEKAYLVKKVVFDSVIYDVCKWSNNLFEVDEYDFGEYKGIGGFYDYDSEFGYLLEDDVVAYMEIPE